MNDLEKLLCVGHRIIEKCYIILIKLFCPVRKNVIVFRSHPDYSDNARALAEYIVGNGYPYKVYFDVDDLSKYADRVPEIVFFSSQAKYGNYKLGCLHLLYTAGYLMSTHKMILTPSRAQKNQRTIRLWHGCSFKERSVQDGNGVRAFDAALVPGELFVKTKAYFWNVDEKYVWPTGYPRYDWLRTRDEGALKLINAYKINQETKVLLWMPTFRNDKRGRCTESNSITQFPLIDHIEKWKELDRLCASCNIVIIVKLHPYQSEYEIPFNEFSNIKEITNQIFDEADVPMYKFVALTDALLSDYSSIAIDYLIVDRPIAYTLDDFEEYRKTRGFLVEDPRVYMPGYHLYVFDDLKRFILDLFEGKDLYKEQREQMGDQLIVKSDNYCKGILDRLNIKS